jgi:hypothetical protein
MRIEAMKRTCLSIIGGLIALGVSTHALSAEMDDAITAPPVQTEQMDVAFWGLGSKKGKISPQKLARLTPKDLDKMNQKQLDKLYAQLTAGPIPDGQYKGSVILSKDAGIRRIAELLSPMNLKVPFKFIEWYVEHLWKGKHFYKDEGVLRNMITRDQSVITVLDWLILPGHVNPNDFRTARWNGRTVWELFPAKLSCGHSLQDASRESVVIDYAYSDTLSDYQPNIDFLAARQTLGVRDEIRMIRPGFYLGRAYLQKVFALNFVLYNEDVATQGNPADAADECWTGTAAFN